MNKGTRRPVSSSGGGRRSFSCLMSAQLRHSPRLEKTAAAAAPAKRKAAEIEADAPPPREVQRPNKRARIDSPAEQWAFKPKAGPFEIDTEALDKITFVLDQQLWRDRIFMDEEGVTYQWFDLVEDALSVPCDQPMKPDFMRAIQCRLEDSGYAAHFSRGSVWPNDKKTLLHIRAKKQE